MFFASIFGNLEYLSFTFILFTFDMTRVSLGTSQLPKDVLIYTSKRFSTLLKVFVEKTKLIWWQSKLFDLLIHFF